MAIEVLPEELADTQAEDTELEPTDPLAGGVPSLQYLRTALRRTGLDEIANIPERVIVAWDEATRLAVWNFCRGEAGDDGCEKVEPPEVLVKYFTEPAIDHEIVAVLDALAFAGIPDFASITAADVESWGPEVRAAVIAFCRQDETTGADLEMPDVLNGFITTADEAAADSATDSTSSTALVPVDALTQSEPVDIITEAEFAERLDSKLNEFSADIQALDAWMTRVHAATAETDEAEREYLSLKEQTSEAKKVYEAKVIALRSITRSQPGPQREFPFVGEQGSQPTTQADSSTPAEPVMDADHNRVNVGVTNSQEKQDAAADERSWRAWPLESLASIGLQPRALKAMAGAGLETVGQLSDWQAKHGDFWFKEIKGMGKKVGDNVADVMERFWRERPDRNPSNTTAAAGAA